MTLFVQVVVVIATVAAVATVTEVVEATTTTEGDTRYVKTFVFELQCKEIGRGFELGLTQTSLFNR